MAPGHTSHAPQPRTPHLTGNPEVRTGPPGFFSRSLPRVPSRTHQRGRPPPVSLLLCMELIFPLPPFLTVVARVKVPPGQNNAPISTIRNPLFLVVSGNLTPRFFSKVFFEAGLDAIGPPNPFLRATDFPASPSHTSQNLFSRPIQRSTGWFPRPLLVLEMTRAFMPFTRPVLWLAAVLTLTEVSCTEIHSKG